MAWNYSFYNINVFEEGYTQDEDKRDLYYNTMSNRFAHIPKELDLDIDTEKFEELKEKRMVVPSEINQTEIYKKQQQRAFIEQTNYMSLLIAVSTKCNYQCEYCFQGSHQCGVNMSGIILESTISYIKKALDNNTILKVLSVTWFGGEPLLNMTAIRTITAFLLDYTRERGIEYRASIDTNGYLLTKEISIELRDLGVRRVQIAFDGFEEYYNRIRKAPSNAFNKVLQNIENSAIPILIRINVTKKNQEEIKELIRFFYTINAVKEKRATVSIMRVSLYENNSDYDFTDEEWLEFRECLADYKDFPTAENFYYIPKSTCLTCSMLNRNNFVVDAEGYLYRCDRHTSDKSKAIGHIMNGIDEDSVVEKQFCCSVIDNECMECKFLPICGGDFCRYSYLKEGKLCTLVKGQFRQNMTNYLSFLYKE